MPIGIVFEGMAPVQQYLRLAAIADDAGADSIWIAEHICYRDALGLGMALLAATKRVRIVPGPVSPYVRHPMTIAMAAATLEELAPGRVGLQLGTGNPRALDEIGVSIPRPLSTIRESVAIIRQLYGGDFVNFDGKTLRVAGARLGFVPSTLIPIYLAAVGPKMLSLAGEISDGVVLSAGLSPRYVRHSLAWADEGRTRAGRNRAEVRKVGLIVASVAADRSDGLEGARTFMAYILRNAIIAQDWGMCGLEVDQPAIFAALKRRDWDTARRLVSDKAIMTLSASGTPQDCQRKIREYLDAGVDLPVILPLGSEENQKLALRAALEFAK